MKTYEVLFNKECDTYNTKNPEYNMMFLRYTETMFNDILWAKGYVFLRDIMECIGIKPTKDTLLAGWVFDERYKYTTQINLWCMSQEGVISILFPHVEEDISYAFDERESKKS